MKTGKLALVALTLAATLTGTLAARAAETADAPAADAPAAPAADAPAAPKAPKVKKPRATKPPGEKPVKATTPRVKGTAYVRVLHAVVGAPAADVYLDGKVVLTAVAFKDLSKYLPVVSGKHAVKITATGKTDALLENSATFSKDKFYTVAAFGEAGKTEADKPAFLNINESTGSGESSKGKARVFVMHLAPGAPAVDITTPSKNAAGTASFLKNVTYGKKRSKAAKPMTVTLQVRADGKIIKEVADVKLEADKKYSVFALGKAGAADDFDVLVAPAAMQ